MGKKVEEINKETDYIVSFDMRPEDTEVYMKYIAPLPKDSIVVDFGTGQAKNVIRMALCAPQVQIWTWDWGRGGESEPVSYFKMISDRLRKHRVDNVYFTINNSNEAWTTWDKPIDILNIDAAHDYEITWNDLIRWGNFVKYDGYIFIHDYEYKGHDGYKFEGMRKAVQEYCVKGFEFIEYIGGTQVIKKYDIRN